MARNSAFLTLFIAALLTPLSGVAASTSESDLARMADAAFRQGDYPRAVDLGRRAGTARGSAVAAWAGLVEGEFFAPPSERSSDIRQAEQEARRALAFDDQNVDGHLALVVALGFIGREEGGLAAHFDGIATEAREHIDQALALAPSSPWANALLGGWNLEIVYDGGSLGEQVYGASLEQGVDAYAKALSLDPGNAQIAYQYAVELLALKSLAHRQTAHGLLAGIVTHPPEDSLSALIRGRAQAVLDAFDRHDEAQLAKLVRQELRGRP